MGMASFAACECGAEEQTVEHVVLQCPIYRPPMECTAWWFWMMRQSIGCSTPAPRSSAAKQFFNNWLKRQGDDPKLFIEKNIRNHSCLQFHPN